MIMGLRAQHAGVAAPSPMIIPVSRTLGWATRRGGAAEWAGRLARSGSERPAYGRDDVRRAQGVRPGESDRVEAGDGRLVRAMAVPPDRAGELMHRPIRLRQEVPPGGPLPCQIPDRQNYPAL